MQYEEKTNNIKSVHPVEVLQYCCDQFVNDKVSFVLGFTEHNRECDGIVYKFRAHPSYRGDSGQRCNAWYDWADFLYETQENGDDGETITNHAPAQIVCFLHLGPDNTPLDSKVIEHGLYAVVQSFDNPVIPFPPSKIIFEGTLENYFYLYSCDTINGTAAVVPNIIGGGRDNDENTYSFHGTNFFVVKNRHYWLSLFHEIMDDLS